jgi:hypothetical protein
MSKLLFSLIRINERLNLIIKTRIKLAMQNTKLDNKKYYVYT